MKLVDVLDCVCHILLFSLSGKQEEVDATLETLKVVQGRLSHWAAVMVDICAYAGT